MTLKGTYEERLADYADTMCVFFTGNHASSLTIRNLAAKRLKSIIGREAAQALGRRGGRKTSPAKVESSQANGRKGGRLRKVTDEAAAG